MIPTPLNVFIGYDSREPIAYHVLAHSILRRASRPVSITPLALDNLRGIYTRERTAKESTEFSMSRFLVPFLSGYQGYSVFMDSDMLCRVDLCELSRWINSHSSDRYAVWCCQHDYQPSDTVKFLGQIQTPYPRKNWSSLMVFDNARCRQLSPQYVNAATGLDLHRFVWLNNDALIGSLPLTWNWLVGEYQPNTDAQIVHWTLGGPWFADCEHASHAEEWFAERDAMLGAAVAA